MTRVLTTLLLLTMAALTGAQEIMPRRAEPVKRLPVPERLPKYPSQLDPYHNLAPKPRYPLHLGDTSGWLTEPHSFPLSDRKVELKALHVQVLKPNKLEPFPGSLFSGERIRNAQRQLFNSGYLGSKADVDGKIGPRTHQALARFQKESGLTVTGIFDAPTEKSLGSSHPWRKGFSSEQGSGLLLGRDPLFLWNQSIREPASNSSDVRLEDLKSPNSLRYRLRDASDKVIWEYNDPAQLAEQLKDLLSQGDRQAISIETPDFSQNASDALASSLIIQLRQIDPTLSVVVPPVAEDSASNERLSTTHGLRLERTPIVIERIDSGIDAGTFSAKVSFSVRVAQRVRIFTLRIVDTSMHLIVEFLERLHVLRPSSSFDASLSLQELVTQAREDLKKTHPGLTDEQLRVMTINQAGKTGLVELRFETALAWS